MEEFIRLKEEELKAEQQKALQQLAELQAIIHRIEGAFVMLTEMRAKLDESTKG